LKFNSLKGEGHDPETVGKKGEGGEKETKSFLKPGLAREGENFDSKRG